MLDVVIPTKNCALDLDRCLHALKKQVEEVNMIVVDAGSRDGTREVAERHNVTLLDEPPSTVKGSRRAVACNWGLKHCSSEFVGFLDADSVPPPEWSRDMVTALKRNMAACAGVTSGCVSDDSTSLRRAVGTLMRAASSHSRCFTAETVVESIPGYNSAYWRDIVLMAGGFSEDIGGCEDWELNRRIRGMGYLLLGVPESPVRHRENLTLRAFGRQMYGYGWSRGRLLRVKRIFTPLHALPTLTLAAGAALFPLTAIALTVLSLVATLTGTLTLFAASLVMAGCWSVGYLSGLTEGEA